MDFMNAPNPYSGLGGNSAEIPELVTVGDLPAVTDSTVSLGIGPSGPVVVDLDSESPHVLVNAPTGEGKSAVARSLAVQRLAAGDMVVVLDVKMHSHRWARDLAPNVFYADTHADVGSALVNLGVELQRRNQVVRDWDGPLGSAPVGPRIIVVFEETNATLTHLKALDKRLAPGAKGAMESFSDIMFMGRAVKMHMIGFAQLASYRSGLSQDVLENFSTRVMIGYSDKAWRWLAGDCGRYVVAPSGVGRSMVIRKGRATECQLAWVPEEEAAGMVLESVPAQRFARSLAGSRARLPEVWRQALGR